MTPSQPIGPDAPVDLVVLGATGTTGRQIAAYLATADTGLRWAIAGRNADKLSALAASLNVDVPSLVVDLDDAASVVTLVRSCDLVLNAVGPSTRHGDTIWAACALTGTHQVDLCADFWWLRDAIAAHDASAKESGSRIVHSAGFLALPFDLVTLVGAETLRDRHDSPLSRIDVAIEVQPDAPILNLNDVMSGGTIASSVEVLRRGGELSVRDVRMLIGDDGPPVGYDTAARQHPGTGQWLAPMMPTPYVNPVIVHRTQSLVADDSLIDPDFRFQDGLVIKAPIPGVPDSLAATWLAGTQFFGAMLGSAPAPMRTMVADGIAAFLPQSAGPSQASLDGWRWTLHARATARSGDIVDLRVLGDGHLGYRSSANLAAEAALAVLDGAAAAGVLTPGAAFGTAEVPRFEAAGMQIIVEGSGVVDT